MSEVKRYSLTLHKVKGKFKSPEFERDNGEWVKWQDYARLKAEVEKIETEVASIGSEYMAATRHYNLLCNNLKAEVERLRKAGDEMHRAIKVSDPILDWKIELWNAAKEGKQS